MFSGLNLAFFSISRLRLEVEVAQGNPAALKVRDLRRNTNVLLSTVLWGNVAINVLLTLLSDSVLTGLGAFFFSTVVITIFGEILPQAYFVRHALKMAALLSPILNVYKILLYPVVLPVARLLDAWMGPEGIQYFREHDLRVVIKKHIDAEASDIDRLEGIGALNFLAIDDLNVYQEGEMIDPKSVIALPSQDSLLVFPPFSPSPEDPFLQKVQASGKKWAILTDLEGQPRLALDCDGFLRSALFGQGSADPHRHCHRPVIVKSPRTALGKAIVQLKVHSGGPLPDQIENDVILLWTPGLKRIITGGDILGRLLLGVEYRDLSPGRVA
jgi:hypothetical protein